MESVLFYIFATIAIITALAMVTTRRSVTAAMCMVGTMFCLAGLYVLQDAHLMAVLKIIVYAGAIMVLTLFVIMLLNLREKEGTVRFGRHRPLIQLVAITVVGLILIRIVAMFHRRLPSAAESGTDNFGTVAAVGELLFSRFLLQFELASVLLLVAIVGAVILARGQKRS